MKAPRKPPRHCSLPRRRRPPPLHPSPFESASFRLIPFIAALFRIAHPYIPRLPSPSPLSFLSLAFAFCNPFFFSTFLYLKISFFFFLFLVSPRSSSVRLGRSVSIDPLCHFSGLHRAKRFARCANPPARIKHLCDARKMRVCVRHLSDAALFSPRLAGGRQSRYILLRAKY